MGHSVFMTTLIDVLNVFLPLGYGVLAGLYGLWFRGLRPIPDRWRSVPLPVLLALHVFYLGLRTVAFDHPPITTVNEILSVVALAVAGSYAIIEHRTRVRNTGVFILSMAGIFQVFSSLGIEPLTEVPPQLRSVLLGIHVTCALAGFAAFAISAVYALLYLILYHDLKRSRFGLFYERLPNLESLESLVTTSIVTGFLLLTVGIVLGLIWFQRVVGYGSWFDPKLVGTALVWMLYAIGILRYRLMSWGGRRMMFISIVGFMFSLLSLTVVNAFFTGFHNFR